MPKATVRLDEGLKATITMRDHVVISDEPLDEGGTDQGAMPRELVLAALGACAAITAKLYAQRKKWPLEGVEIDLFTDRFKKADYPAYTGEGDFVHEVRQRIVFKGPLTDEQKNRLLEIAGKCPVHRLLTEPNFMIEELVDSLVAQEN